MAAVKERQGGAPDSLFVQDLFLRWKDRWFCRFRINLDAVHF